ncbi:uncharacterized protein LOC122049393 [Zingiber officinale]|uniref:Uncharacterized protein n=1 Tax=Zingiber officinale TaxID=94328 RepID=A0A8J5HHF9_ZINOF|nr:uncharacterized protein LOC122049393 [Zingiber officinale]KAG6525230.1 hypothetical protein ZIOFF_015184 [Zingiber officinale]
MLLVWAAASGSLQDGSSSTARPVAAGAVAAGQALPPPSPCAMRSPSTWHSLETLAVVLALITMAAVIAGVFARACAGRGRGGERDVGGWVERKCSSCLGLPPPPSK